MPHRSLALNSTSKWQHYLVGKRKTIGSIYLTQKKPCEGGRYDQSPGPAPTIYNTDEKFYCTHPLFGSKKQKEKERCQNEYYIKYRLLCLNEKEKKTYYRAYDGWKLAIDLTLANITIALETNQSKENDLRGSNHFPVFLTDDP